MLGPKAVFYGAIDDEVSVLPPLLLGSEVELVGAVPTTTGEVMIEVVPVIGVVPAEVAPVAGVLPVVMVMPVNPPVPVVVAPVTEVAPGVVPVVVPVLVFKPILLVVVEPVVFCVAGTAPVATSGVAAPEESLLPPHPNRADVAIRHAKQPRIKLLVIAFSKSIPFGVLLCRHVDASARQLLIDIKAAQMRCT